MQKKDQAQAKPLTAPTPPRNQKLERAVKKVAKVMRQTQGKASPR